MDTLKVTKPDGTVIEISEGDIAKALLAGKSVLIAAPRSDWAARAFNAWIDECEENCPPDLTFVSHPAEMHIAFSNNAVLQVMVLDSDAKVHAFAGRLFDLFKPILISTPIEARRAQELANYVLSKAS